MTFRSFDRTPEPALEKVTPERVRRRMTQVETACDVRAEVEAMRAAVLTVLEAPSFEAAAQRSRSKV